VNLSEGYTWVSVVSRHTGKNVGVIVLEGHVELAWVEIQASDHAQCDDPVLVSFLESAVSGKLYHRSELPMPVVNTDGEPR